MSKHEQNITDAISWLIKNKLEQGMSESDFIKLVTDQEGLKCFIKAELEHGVSEQAKQLKHCSEDVLVVAFKKCLKAMLPSGLVVAASAFEALLS